MRQTEIDAPLQSLDGTRLLGMLDIPAALADDRNIPSSHPETSCLHGRSCIPVIALGAVRNVLNMKIGGITDQFAHQVIDRGYQHIATLAEFRIGPLAPRAGNRKIAHNGQALHEMLAVGKAEGTGHEGASLHDGWGSGTIERIRNKVQSQSPAGDGLWRAPTLLNVIFDNEFELVADVGAAQRGDLFAVDIDGCRGKLAGSRQ